MAVWTTPITWANGQVTKAQMDTEVRDHLNWLKAAFNIITGSTADDEGTSTLLSITRAASGDEAIRTRVGADTQSRVKIEAGGRILHGSGSAVGDVSLERRAAGEHVLGSSTGTYRLNLQSNIVDINLRRTDGAIRAVLNLGSAHADSFALYRATGAAGSETTSEVLRVADGTNFGLDAGTIALSRLGATDQILAGVAPGEANPRWVVERDGLMSWGPGGASAPDISWSRVTNVLGLSAGIVIGSGAFLATRVGGSDGVLTAGIPHAVGDGDFGTTPPNGLIAIDTANKKLAVRIGGLWYHTAAMT